MEVTGISPDETLVEIVELKDHPWFLGCQFHPEFKSKPFNPASALQGFYQGLIDLRAGQRTMAKEVKIGDVRLGADSPTFTFIGGPCVIEGRDITLRIAERLAALTARLAIPFVFKASYDKANRTSVRGFRGPGLKAGLEILAEVRRIAGIPVLTDVHSIEEAAAAAQVVDCLQVPALLSRQTDLLVACGNTGKAVNIKKGPVHVSPTDGTCHSQGGIDGECEHTRHRTGNKLRLQ